jgi:hypothetical protein
LGQEKVLILVPLYPSMAARNLYSRMAVLIIKAMGLLGATGLAQRFAQVPKWAAQLPSFGAILFRDVHASANSE